MDQTFPQRSLLAKIFLSPDERRLRAGWRVLAHFLILVALFAAVMIPLTIVMNALRLSNVIVEVVSMLAIGLVITLSVFIARRWLDRRSFISLGLVWNKLAVGDLFFGIGVVGLMMSAIYTSFWALGWIRFEAFAWQVDPLPRVLQGTLLMLYSYVWVGWYEELIARGYWLQNIASGLNLFWGVIISSSIFALAHLVNPNASWVAVLGLVAAALFLAYAYLATGQLWLAVGIHIGWNFFQGTVFGFPVSGTDSYRLIRHTLSGPEIVTGGAFGPEAGLIVIPALLLGTALIYLYTRGRRLQNP